MNDWPEGWFRDETGKAPASSGAAAGSSEPTVALPYGGRGSSGEHGSPAPQGPRGPQGPQPPGRPGAWPEQPPARTGRPPAAPGSQQPRRRGWRRPGRWVTVIAVLLVLVIIAAACLYFLVNSKLHRADVLVNYPGRPAAADGQNWLITGSDSRQGLTRAQERKYSTGVDIGGGRSDTIMVLHIPAHGTPVLISLPRDSYVAIPGHGYNKINAAYSFGGPRLLAQTVQNATGLRIEHYMGIGFGGFVNVVNAVGGVRMCLPGPLRDKASGLNLSAGCHNLTGGEALSYVRDRHDFSDQDLQRVQDQRLFLRALLDKLTSTGTLVNPFATIPAAFGVAGSLTVDQGTHLYQLVEVAFAMRHPETTTVPIANPNDDVPYVGDAVLWNTAQARELFGDLNAGRPVPNSLLSGSSLASQSA